MSQSASDPIALLSKSVPTSVSHTTPTKRGPYSISGGSNTAEAIAAARTQSILRASPAYGSNLRKSSLYGTEDRIIIDPGSRFWKVGFSGEPAPRRTFNPFPSTQPSSFSSGSNSSYSHSHDSVEENELWDIDFPSMMHDVRERRERWTTCVPENDDDGMEVVEEDREGVVVDENSVRRLGGEGGGLSRIEMEQLDAVLRSRLRTALRDTFHKYLLTDPRSRKVIILENPFLPNKIKEMIVSILFDNLAVPSVSFIQTGLAAILATGRTTALVVDVGHLETTVLPIFAVRSLHSHLSTTPIAGRAFLRRLSALLRRFGQYQPSKVLNRPMMPKWKTGKETVSAEAATGAGGESAEEDVAMEGVESEGIPSDLLTRTVLEDIRIKACSVSAQPRASTPSEEISPAQGIASLEYQQYNEAHLQALRKAYQGSTPHLPDYRYAIPCSSGSSNTSHKSVRTAEIIVPGWIRQCVAEIFFEESDGDEHSVAEAISGCLLRLPNDLRASMSSTILVIGGGGMLKGFMPRLHTTLTDLLKNDDDLPGDMKAPDVDISMETKKPATAPFQRAFIRGEVSKRRESKRRDKHKHPFADLAGLLDNVAILNDQFPGAAEGSLAGSAPRWHAHLMAWVGGSIAGALQIGGGEIFREEYDAGGETKDDHPAAGESGGGVLEIVAAAQSGMSTPRSLLGDWSRPLAEIRA